MSQSAKFSTSPSRYELRFTSLFNGGSGYVFPCDELGSVDINSLSERLRTNYFFVRSVIGREFSLPSIAAVG